MKFTMEAMVTLTPYFLIQYSLNHSKMATQTSVVDAEFAPVSFGLSAG
jgi:hypothetical protein